MKMNPKMRKLLSLVGPTVYLLCLYLLTERLSEHPLLCGLIGALTCALYFFASALLQAFLLKDREALAIFKSERPLVNCLQILLGALFMGFLTGLLFWFF